MSSYRSRVALRAAATRIRRERDRAPARSSDEVDDERESKGKPTLREQRCGLPPATQAKKLATHTQEDSKNSWVATDDPHVYGVRVSRVEPPIQVGDPVRLVCKATGAVVHSRVTEVQGLTSTYFTVCTTS